MGRSGFFILVAAGLAAGGAAASETVIAPLASVAEVTATRLLSSEAEALRDAVASAENAALRTFYGSNAFEPIWTEDRKGALLVALDEAEAHGLPAARYDRAGLAQLFTAGADLAQEAEVAASIAFLAYARDISSGVIEPRRADRDIVVTPPRPDAANLLVDLARSDDPKAFLAALAPSHPDYARLVDDRVRLLDVIAAGGWGEPFASTRTLRPGDQGAAVADLRARLGRIEGKNYGDSPIYDSELGDALRAFQLRHGLNDDGVIGPKTREALNASAEDRLKQVLVNLERQRWLNVERGERHILVNQADFMARVVDKGETTFTTRVVIGKNGHRTQEFNDEMTYMVINPTWHVPRSIATEEMLPRLKRNPGTLGGSFDVMTRSGTRINPKFVNFSQFNRSNFPFIIKQRPGSSNALGKVKFMFPNDFNIYLHDTPSKSLFNRDVRAYSHGCVRVQKPFELAYHLLAAQSDDPKGLFQGYLGKGREQYLNLDTPVPIYLTYQSVVFDEAGLAQYRADVYGRDARVFRALSDAGVSLGLAEG